MWMVLQPSERKPRMRVYELAGFEGIPACALIVGVPVWVEADLEAVNAVLARRGLSVIEQEPVQEWAEDSETATTREAVTVGRVAPTDSAPVDVATPADVEPEPDAGEVPADSNEVASAEDSVDADPTAFDIDLPEGGLFRSRRHKRGDQ